MLTIGVIYLGRRGSGGKFSLELAHGLLPEAHVFAAISSGVENRQEWEKSSLALLQTATFDSPLTAALSFVDQTPIRRLAGQIRVLKPDVLIFPMLHPWDPTLQTLLADIPSVVILHDPLPHPGIRDLFHAYLQDQTLARATRCVVLNQALLPAVQSRGVSLDRVDVLPHGILTYGTPGAGESSKGSVLDLLFFGRVTPYKGLDTLLQAFVKVQQRYPEARLSIVGEGSLHPYRKFMTGVQNLVVTNRWILENEIAGIFHSAGMVILPYTSASQSGVVALAAGFGLPVVASRVGGLPEQIEDGRTGLLVEPNSPEQLARAIISLIEDPVKAAGLGENLRQEFLTQRNWSSIARKMLAICRKAIEARQVAQAGPEDG